MMASKRHSRARSIGASMFCLVPKEAITRNPGVGVAKMGHHLVFILVFWLLICWLFAEIRW
jgi:hypothetical protein